MIEINKSNYKDYDFHDIIAFSIASPGAMGDRGAVVIVTSEGKVYHTNPYWGDMTEEETFQICPPLKECHFGMFGGGNIPEGWRSFYLGGGNLLVVNDVIVPQFLEITEKEVNQKGGYLHNKWLDLVLEIINVSLYDNKPKQKEL